MHHNPNFETFIMINKHGRILRGSLRGIIPLPGPTVVLHMSRTDEQKYNCVNSVYSKCDTAQLWNNK